MCIRDSIYTSRFCYDVSVRLSVCLWVTEVHCGHGVCREEMYIISLIVIFTHTSQCPLIGRSFCILVCGDMTDIITHTRFSPTDSGVLEYWHPNPGASNPLSMGGRSTPHIRHSEAHFSFHATIWRSKRNKLVKMANRSTPPLFKMWETGLPPSIRIDAPAQIFIWLISWHLDWHWRPM